MLHHLELKNWPVHGNRSFDFNPGLIAITGANESGKSLILEALSFALYGSSQLRLAAKNYQGIEVVLLFTVKGQQYTVERSLSNAKLQGGGLSVQGTTPVTKAISALLGYGQNVFNLANLCKQDQIKALSTLTGTERKRAINHMVGLEPVELAIKHYNQQRSELSKAIRTLEQTKPNDPSPCEPPTGYDFDSIINAWLERNAQKPPFALPCPPPEFDLQLKRNAEAVVVYLSDQLAKIKPAMLTYDVDAIIEQEQAHQDYQGQQRRLQRGGVTCESCGHLNYFEEVGELLNPVEKPLVGSLEAKRANQAASAYDPQAHEQLKQELRVAKQEVAKYPFDLHEQWQSHRQYLAYHAWVDTDFEQPVSLEQARLDQKAYLAQENQYKLYCTLLEQNERWGAHYTKLTDDLVELDKLREGLKQTHESLKTTLLPAINYRASAFLQQMSAGSHNSLMLTDEMLIEVDGLTIDALSGSGQALGHLALRLALGSVLATANFPVIMFDEVDAGMDLERATAVVDMLRSMTKDYKQVIVISHKQLPYFTQHITL